jgi:hypothetical protein
VAAWWRSIEAENPQAIVARDMPSSDRPSADERYLRNSGRYQLTFHAGGVRVYTTRH